MIEILKYEAVGKGAIIAKFTAKIGKWAGFLIKECVLFESSEKKWITFPRREYEVEGKKKYFEFVAFEDRDMNDKFKGAILHAVLEHKSKLTNHEPSNSQDDCPF